MKLAVFGSTDVTPSISYAASVAGMAGILAGRRTLLVDLGETPAQTHVLFGGTKTAGLEALVEHYTQTQIASAQDVMQHIIPVAAPATWTGWAGRTFDFLPGPSEISPIYLDRLAAWRGREFVRGLMKAVGELDYALAIVNLDRMIDTLYGDEVLKGADLMVLHGKTAESTPDPQKERGRKYPIKSSCDMRMWEDLAFAYPDPCFVEALVSKKKVYELSVPRLALAWAEFLFSDIRTTLREATGRPIKPYESLSSKIFG